MRHHLFFSLILVLGLSLGLSSCTPGIYTSTSVGGSYGYPAYGYGGYRPHYYAPRYYAPQPRYYAPRYYAPRPIIVTPRASYPGGFGGGERGWRGGGGGHYGSRPGR